MRKTLLGLGVVSLAIGAASATRTLAAPSDADNAYMILQGQSNASRLADWDNSANDFRYIAGPLVNQLTGLAVTARGHDPNGSPSSAYTIYGGSETYKSGDSSLWLAAPPAPSNPNPNDPYSWNLGVHGSAARNYLQSEVGNRGKDDNPVAFFRFHSEYDGNRWEDPDANLYYPAANRRFIDLMRSSVNLNTVEGRKKMPIFLGVVPYAQNSGWNTLISAWSSEVKDKSRNTHWAYGTINDIDGEFEEGIRADNHIADDTPSRKLVAARMAISCAKWLNDNGYSKNDLSKLPRLGPRIKRFTRVSSNQIEITIEHEKGTSLVISDPLPGGGVKLRNLKGFRVFDLGNDHQWDSSEWLEKPDVSYRPDTVEILPDKSTSRLTTLLLTLVRSIDGGTADLSTSIDLRLGYLNWATNEGGVYNQSNGYYGLNSLITDNYHKLVDINDPEYNASLSNSYIRTAFASFKQETGQPLTLPLRRLNYWLPIDTDAEVEPDDAASTPPANQPPIGRTISLKSKANNLFVSANQGDSWFLVASWATYPYTWEKYVVEDAGGNGLVALRSVGSNKYVTVDVNSPEKRLRADWASWIVDWGKFWWQDLGNNEVALKSFVTNKYVSRDNDLYCKAKWADQVYDWEKFILTIHN